MSWRAWAAFLALGIIWGVPYFFIKIAVAELSPYVVAWSRVTLAALVLLPLAWQRGALRAVDRHWKPILAFATAEFVVPFAVISIGERWIPSSVTGILIAGVPLTITVISRFFGVHEPLGAARLLGLGIGFIGVVALLGLGTISTPLQWAGVGCMLLATVGYAIGALIIQRHLAGVDSLGPIAASLVTASLVLLTPAVLTFPNTMPSTIAIVSIAVLGILCTATAMLLMFYLVSHAGASRASVITYINPIVATLLGIGVLHERLGLGGAIGFALILLGSWLATRAGPPKRASEAAGNVRSVSSPGT